ncbi:MAG: transcriptional regulator [Planctomycetes bacterium]|nr:transcriptional regulator [Planctomycetota bacterium]MCB9892309.1 transcriptional regulator [Planctomycetota bacterium]
MKKVEKIEVVIDAPHSSQVVAVFEKHGLGGWSRIREVSGFGERGERGCDDITGVTNNHLLVTTCAPEALPRLLEELRPLLERHGGVCLVTEARWLMHGKDHHA